MAQASNATSNGSGKRRIEITPVVRNADDLKNDIKNCYSKLYAASKYRQQAKNQNQSTVLESAMYSDIVEELQELQKVCKKGELAAKSLGIRADQERQEAERLDQQRHEEHERTRGTVGAVEVPKGSAVYKKHFGKSTQTDKHLAKKPMMYRCGMADTDGICRCGPKEFSPTRRKGDVKVHIKKIHDKSPRERKWKDYASLGDFTTMGDPRVA